MREFAAIEINSLGIVTFVSLPSTYFWEEIFPCKGKNIFQYWDDNINKQIKEYSDEIFKTSIQVKRSINIHSKTFNCTAFRSTYEKATICFETTIKTLFENIEPDVKNKLLLTNFAFENANTAIHFVKEDGSFFDFNDALNKMLGYSRQEFLKLNITDIVLNATADYWKMSWKSLIKNGGNTFNTRTKKKDGSLIDVEIKNTFINYEGIELNCAFINDITERSKIENELLLLDFSFRKISTPIIFFRKDGSIYDFNDAYCHLLGYDRDQLMSLSLFDLGTAYTIQSFNQYWERVKTEGTFCYLTKRTKKDETIIDVEITPNFIKFGDLELICSFVKDVTEHKKLEKQLKLVGYVFEKVDTAICFINQEGFYYQANDAMCVMLGYTMEEIFKMKIFDINPSINEERWEEIWERQKRGGKKTVYERLKKKDGNFINVEIKPKMISFEGTDLSCALITDISEKIRTQRQLEIIGNAFENVSTAIYFIKKDGTYFQSNNAMCTMLGYSKEEFKELTVFDINPRVTIERWTEIWNGQKEESFNTVYSILKRKDGTLLDVEIKSKLILHQGLELICAFGIDITEQKKLEESLKLVDFAFRNSAMPIHFLNEKGEVFDCNQAACNLLGYSREEYLNLNIFQINQNITLDDFKKNWATLTETSNRILQFKITLRNRQLFDAEIRSNKIKYGNQELMCSSFFDITEKKRAELELRRSNERYENALLATSDVIWEADLIKNRIYYSKNFTLVYGHPIDEQQDMINNKGRHNFHPDDIERVNEIMKDLIQGTKEKWDFEYRMKKADNSYAIVLDRGFSVKDETGNIVRLVGAMQDITKKKAEETRLKLLESVAVHMNDAIVITEAEPFDEPGPRIIYVNDAYTKITGYKLEEIIGTTPRKLQNSNTDRIVLDKFKMALKNWQPTEMTVRNVRKNGEEFWGNVRVTPVADETGWFTHWISVQRDVTKEIEAHAERESLLNELMTHNNELKQFGYITTHNLRAPLTNLLSICKMIDESKIEDSKTRKLIGGFKESTFLLNDTLNDLINILFIKDHIHLTTTDLHFDDSFLKAKALIANAIESNSVVIEADFSLAPIVKFSPIYMESLFLNLLTNSIKYAHPKRHIEIKIYSELLPDNRVRLEFGDNGLGMNMERVRGKIFGLYQRFHDNSDSKGLGLYLLHSQISTLGGTIEVESEENVGTRFIIIFKNEVN